jgi:hypothetical protein
MAAPSMNELAETYRPQGVASVFLYTHEAHPGEHYPHLTSKAQKFRHARDLRDILGVTRPIFVDSLDGACHRRFGSMPNMTWIFTKGGIPVYKSDWTDPASVQNAIDYFLDGVERRKSGARLVPFCVQRMDFRARDEEAFYKGLERSGPKAVEEFKKAFE